MCCQKIATVSALAVLALATVPGAVRATQDYGPVPPPELFSSAFKGILETAGVSPEQVGLTPLFCTSNSMKHPIESCYTWWLSARHGENDDASYHPAEGNFFTGARLSLSESIKSSESMKSDAGKSVFPGGAISLSGQYGKILWGGMRIVLSIRKSNPIEILPDWKSMDFKQIAQARSLQKAFLEKTVICKNHLEQQILINKVLYAWRLSAVYENKREIKSSCGYTTITRVRELYEDRKTQMIEDHLLVRHESHIWGFPSSEGAKQ